MNIEDFWADIYSRLDKTEENLAPRQVSLLLDQAQRQLMMIVDHMLLQDLGGIYDFISLQELESGQSTYEMGEQTISQFRMIGDDGMFWPDGPYDDKGSFSWPEGQVFKPELFKIVGLHFTPKYLRDMNALAGGVGIFQADEVSWQEIRNLSSAERGSILKGDDFYERATQTLDLLQGGYATATGVYNVERDLHLRWATFGNNLITWPPVDTIAELPMRVWALFFPERFLDMTGAVKKSFVNDRGQCQLPSVFWPVMTEWVLSRLKAIAAGDQAAALSMRSVLEALSLGDTIGKRSEEDRLARR